MSGGVLILFGSLTSAVVMAQGPFAPAFEVVSIKAVPPSTDDDFDRGRHVGLKISGSRVDIGFSSLAYLIRTAYRVQAYRVSGPNWLGDQEFDVLAKLPEGTPESQVPEMLQAMLADRFKLAVHRETRVLDAYALVVAKDGPPLRDVSSALSHVWVLPGGGMHVEVVTPSELADFLTNLMDRPVVDMTQLTGKYQIRLDISRADVFGKLARLGRAALGANSMSANASDPDGSSIFAGVKRLGLKLESRKLPLEVIVIDHVERRPTEN